MSEKQIVVPGELVTSERKKLGANVFQNEGKIYSMVLGIPKVSEDTASVVALKGRYYPKKNDLVIGIVKEENFSGYVIDINSFYHCFIPKKLLDSMPLKKGTIIQAIISYVNEIKVVDLENIRVLFSGDLIDVSPVKVPRIIGKQGSMLNLLKEKTKCQIIVGQNGRIWIKNGNTKLCIEAIRKIEAESHLSNLTQRIELFLNENLKKGDSNE